MEVDRRIKMRARRADLCFGEEKIRLYAYQEDSQFRTAAKKLELVQCDKRFRLEPFVEIEEQEAQILIDDLWEAGVRPTGARGSAGAMKAVLNHLEDMRKIAFKKLGI
jgi:hypothetical protein